MDLNGTYRGFAPTDESGVAFGELEIVISDDNVSMRHATGLEIQSDQEEHLLIRELTADEVASFFQEDTDTSKTSGYEIGHDGPVMLFCADSPEVPDANGVILLRLYGEEIDSIFGPSVLWRPDQVTAGAYDRSVKAIETEQGDLGVIPRLSNNGKRLESSAI